MSLVAIVGKTGSGKTAMLSKFLTDTITNNQADYRRAKREILGLQSNGFNNLELPPQKHICFSDFDYKLNKRFSSYKIDGYKIGLENKYFKTIKFPVGSSIFLDEAQRYFDSRMSFFLREEVYRWFQLHRHNDYKVYMTAQRLANIDVNIRALLEKIIVIDSLDFQYDEYGFIVKMIWSCHEFTAPDIAEKYQMACESGEKTTLGKKVTYTYNGNVFNYYNSFSNKFVFYDSSHSKYDLLEYDYYTEQGYCFTKQGIKDFNTKNYFVAPKGYYKN